MQQVLIFLVLTLLNCANFAFAKTVLITDIDDTVKVSHVLDLFDAALYAQDTKSRFLGMKEVLSLVRKQDPRVDITYLSRGLKFIIEDTHRKFLTQNNFPEGTYICREDLPADEHKLFHIRKILKEQNPDKVIFIGDNGEMDSLVYHTIVEENKNSTIEFVTLIHLVYSSKNKDETGVVLFPEQVGWATSLEAALELQKHQLIGQSEMQNFIHAMIPFLADESKSIAHHEFIFPDFMDCSDFVWRWNDEIKIFKDLAQAQRNIMKNCRSHR